MNVSGEAEKSLERIADVTQKVAQGIAEVSSASGKQSQSIDNIS